MPQLPFARLTTSFLLSGAIALVGFGPRPVSAQTLGAQEELWDGAVAGDTVVLARAISHGARIDSLDTRRSENGRRALNWAAWHNRSAAVRWLVAHGASVNATNLTGNAPLHHAAENGSVEAARVLLELGADRNLQNADGQRPIDVARAKGRFEVIATLEATPKRP